MKNLKHEGECVYCYWFQFGFILVSRWVGQPFSLRMPLFCQYYTSWFTNLCLLGSQLVPTAYSQCQFPLKLSHFTHMITSKLTPILTAYYVVLKFLDLSTMFLPLLMSIILRNIGKQFHHFKGFHLLMKNSNVIWTNIASNVIS